MSRNWVVVIMPPNPREKLNVDMSPLLIIVCIVLATVVTLHLRRRARAQRSQKLAEKPLDSELIDLLRQHMPLYDRLPPDLQRQLQGLINVFLNGKRFFGCDGLVVLSGFILWCLPCGFTFLATLQTCLREA